MISVESSNINAIDYDGKNLIVEYKTGKKYSYEDVPENIFEDFKQAESKGRFMNSNIKNMYKYSIINE